MRRTRWIEWRKSYRQSRCPDEARYEDRGIGVWMEHAEVDRGRGMIIGTCQIELLIANNHSLKGKRRVIKSIKDRVRSKFNVSIAEIGHQEEWQRSTLGVACISNDLGLVDSILNKVLNLIETSSDATLIDYQIEILP